MLARQMCRSSLVVWAVAGFSFPVTADTVVLNPSKDNTLIQVVLEDPRSNALGDGIYTGRVGALGGGTRRRAVLAFDLDGAVPPKAEITSVTLRLNLIATVSGDQTLTLHALLSDWGEGTSNDNGGQGSLATPGDATWIHTFFDTDVWTNQGGDYSAVASASQVVGPNTGVFYTWGPTAQMQADVEAWLADPAENFGWLLLGNELQTQTVKKFVSKDHFLEDWHPQLVIEFVSKPQCPADFNGDNMVAAADLALLLGSWGECPSCPADINNDGQVDAVDLALLLGSWGDCP